MSFDKNSKLFQKFMQSKAKKAQKQQYSVQTKPKSLTRRQLNISEFDEMNGDAGNDQNVNLVNILNGRQEGEKINKLLKQQLRRQRMSKEPQCQNQSVIQKEKQVYDLKQQIYKLKLQADYLTKENLRLKQQLRQQQTKVQHLQESCQNVEQMQKQIVRLKEQNYLAKEYIYKLTRKLYQSQQLIIPQPQKHQSQKLKQDQRINNVISVSRKRQFSMNSKLIQKGSQQKQRAQMHVSDEGKMMRIKQISRQLEQLQELKVSNGKTRRRKIQLQRQLMELNA